MDETKRQGSLADCGRDGQQIIEQADFLRDVFDQWPELAAFGQKIIIGIDDEQGRLFLQSATLSMILPICELLSITRCAAAASARGKT